MSEEKYITIPFEVWESKYKNMEEENKSLLEQVATLKKNSLIQLRLTRRTDHLWGSGENVGYIEIDVAVPGIFKLNIDRQKIEEAIKSEILQLKTSEMRFGAIKTQEEVIQTIIDYRNQRVKCENATLGLLSRLQQIPRIVKWLFKIKIESL